MIIAIIGPDGSGKTTIAELIVEELEKWGIRARHYPFNFGILPKLSSLKPGRKEKESTHGSTVDTAGPLPELLYDLKTNSPVRSFIYITWYGTDYMLGGLILRVRNLFGRAPHVAVFARYFYDYYYQSNNRLLSPKIKRVIEVIVPRPKFILFLDRDAQDIYKGKSELPVDEIKKQQEIIRESISTYPQFHVIDARAGIEHTVRKVLDVISAEV